MLNVETPCLIIDVEKMKRNINMMAGIARDNGVSLRPHIKTHKIPEIAKMQIEAGAKGITVAKVSEAEIMAANGIDDIFIAYPIIGNSKVERVLDLSGRIRLITGVDSIAGAKFLSDAALARGQTAEVWIEVDTGFRRTGVPYETVTGFASEISKFKGLRITGIYTYKGLTYKGKATDDREKAGLEESQMMVEAARRLEKAGIKVSNISVGSTPTGEFAASVPGITEIRPGTYVFNDAMQVKVGTCSTDDCAAKILVTVISVNSDEYAVIDGGCKTFPTDTALDAFPHYLKGYGMIEGYEEFVINRLSEEHGMVDTTKGAKKPRVGQQLMVIPNHICPAMNLQNHVYFLEKDNKIRKVPVAARGMLY